MIFERAKVIAVPSAEEVASERQQAHQLANFLLQ